tara:strand:- start:209 stop:3268 length:3060 start_codon:yes stop_codon:yes gene_type:complete
MASKVAIEVEIKNIKKIADLKNQLKDLRKAQRDQEKESKSGRFQSKESAKAYKERAKAIKENSKQLRELNKDMAGSTKATKNATKASNSMAKQFIKGAAAIGIVVGAFRAVNRVVSSVVSVFTEFEFVMSKVNAVSGATDQQLEGLTKTAEELGRTTFFTATQVGELMLNFSKLGFSAREIQNAVEPTLALATATGSDLARSATVAGAAVRGFGLDASETSRVVDVMAVSFSSSALDIEKWSTGMTKVAPIAKAAGFSIEDTAAIMAKLSDAGIEASIAGTSLRNILLKMQDPTSDLSQAFGGTIHSLDDLVPAMKKFSEEGGSMAEIMKVVDLRQAAAFEQMISSADATVELRNKLLEANGEADRMAKIIGDTLQGSFLKLTSAIQGLSISIMKDFAKGFQGAIEKLAKFFNVLAENSATITKIINLIATLTKGFIAGFVAVKSYTTALVLGRSAIAAYAAITGTATIATKGFVLGLNRIKVAIAKTGLGLLVIALGEIASKFMFAEEKAEGFNKDLEKTIDLETSLAGIRDGINAIMNKQFAQTVKQGEKDKEIVERELKLRKSLYFASIRGANTLNSAERKAHLDGIKRLKTRLKLEERNISEIKKKNFEKLQQQKDLITIQENALKKAQEMVATDEADLIAKNKLIQSIEKEIARLKELGIEEDKVVEKKKTDNELSLARIRIMKEVLSGDKKLIDAERELRDLAIEKAQIELKSLPIAIFAADEQDKIAAKRIELENLIIDLKLKNQKETEKGAKKEAKSLKENIKVYSDLGSALTTFAGDNEKLNGIREAGEAITRAAAVAESVLNLQKAITAVTEGKLTIATLLGTKATIASTAASTADTAVTTASLGADATKAVLSSGKMFPFPFNLAAIAATIAVISKVLNMFEDGGIIDDGKKFAKGGMVHGASHAQGGVKFAVGGRVNELEGGEAVINKRSTEMFKNELSAINVAGGGVKFADGGLLSSPEFAQAQFSANNQAQMMGAMQGQRKVVVVESDITDSQSSVSVIQANATF